MGANETGCSGDKNGKAWFGAWTSGFKDLFLPLGSAVGLGGVAAGGGGGRWRDEKEKEKDCKEEE